MKIETRGDTARAHLKVEVREQPAIAILRLEKRDRYWRVVEVENAEGLFRQAM